VQVPLVAMLLGLALALACAPAGVLQVRIVSEMLKFLLARFICYAFFVRGWKIPMHATVL
jgi:hypothetical protein